VIFYAQEIIPSFAMNETFISTIKEKITSASSIVLIPHRSPDGDAIGACLALFHFFEQQGKKALVVTPNDFPAFLKWIPGAKQTYCFEKKAEASKKELINASLIFYLDFNSLNRVGGQMEAFLAPLTNTKVMIDHHEEPQEITSYTYSDSSMSSTCEMVYYFLQKIAPEDTISPEIATCLYTGIMTDTGSFRFPATTSNTHKVIAHLIACGANNERIHSNVYDNKSLHRLQLLGRSLNSLAVMSEFKTAYICLTREDLNPEKHRKGDTEGIVNYALSLKGVVFAVLFTEDLEQQLIKISFRSKGTFSASSFAKKHFEGGGHENAAGGRSFKDMEQTVTFFRELLPSYQNDLLSSYD